MHEPMHHFTCIQVMIFVVSTPSVADRSTAFNTEKSMKLSVQALHDSSPSSAVSALRPETLQQIGSS
jgi:hypothetical protein